jgi:hypothetical protein
VPNVPVKYSMAGAPSPASPRRGCGAPATPSRGRSAPTTSCLDAHTTDTPAGASRCSSSCTRRTIPRLASGSSRATRRCQCRSRGMRSVSRTAPPTARAMWTAPPGSGASGGLGRTSRSGASCSPTRASPGRALDPAAGMFQRNVQRGVGRGLGASEGQRFWDRVLVATDASCAGRQPIRHG